MALQAFPLFFVARSRYILSFFLGRFVPGSGLKKCPQKRFLSFSCRRPLEIFFGEKSVSWSRRPIRSPPQARKSITGNTKRFDQKEHRKKGDFGVAAASDFSSFEVLPAAICQTIFVLAEAHQIPQQQQRRKRGERLLEATQKKEKEDFFHFRRYENFVLALGFCFPFYSFFPFLFRVKAITNEEKQICRSRKILAWLAMGRASSAAWAEWEKNPLLLLLLPSIGGAKKKPPPRATTNTHFSAYIFLPVRACVSRPCAASLLSPPISHS